MFSAIPHLTRDGIEKGLAFIVTWTRRRASNTNGPSTMRPFHSTSEIYQLNRPSNFEHSTPNETGELLKLLVKYWNILELQKPNSAGPLRSIQVKLVSSKNIQCIHWFIMVHHFPSKIAFGCFRGVPFLRQIQIGP